MTIVTFDNISKEVRGFTGKPKRLISAVSFSIDPGETVGLIGHNGAGKSTTIKILMNLVRPTTGKMTLFGAAHGASARRRLGYAPETPRLQETLTAHEILQIHERLVGVPGPNVLERVGLDGVANQRVGTFSKGLRQRLSLGVALLGTPDLLVLDEPMSGLDPVGRADVATLIREEQNRGATILFSTHILPDVAHLCDRIIVLRSGNVVLDRKITNDRPSWSITLANGRSISVGPDEDPFGHAARLQREGEVVRSVQQSNSDLEALVLPHLRPAR